MPRAAHPMWGLRAAIDEIIDWAPDLLVVKGDLGHYNRSSEYDLLAPELLARRRAVDGDRREP